MKNFTVIFIALIMIINVSVSPSYSQCGKERWSVKTLTDKDTTKIDFQNVKKSTVQKQCLMKRPTKVKNMPRMKTETNVYEIEAYVVEFKKEADQDYHVVISDLETGENMVIEIVDPDCPGIRTTSRYQALKKVRDWFTDEFNPTQSFKNTHKKVKLTGVGFFDYLHGQRGMSDNGREIHPVLKMEYSNE
jgi:hypothetical protein